MPAPLLLRYQPHRCHRKYLVLLMESTGNTCKQRRTLRSIIFLLWPPAENSSGATINALSVSYDFGMDVLTHDGDYQKHRAFSDLTARPKLAHESRVTGAKPGTLTLL